MGIVGERRHECDCCGRYIEHNSAAFSHPVIPVEFAAYWPNWNDNCDREQDTLLRTEHVVVKTVATTVTDEYVIRLF